MRVRRLDLAVGVAAAALGGWTASLQSGGTPAILGGVLLGASLGVLRGIPMLGFALAVAGTTLAGIDGSIADGPMALLLVASFGIGLYAGRVAGVRRGRRALRRPTSRTRSAPTTGSRRSCSPPSSGVPAARCARTRSSPRRLKERAAELAEEREAYAQLSVRYERARIAAELHDIVAHAISVMVVQASAGQRLAAVDPELTTETFHVIADAARQAEDDMGRLVALLGDEAGRARAGSRARRGAGRARRRQRAGRHAAPGGHGRRGPGRDARRPPTASCRRA